MTKPTITIELTDKELSDLSLALFQRHKRMKHKNRNQELTYKLCNASETLSAKMQACGYEWCNDSYEWIKPE